MSWPSSELRVRLAPWNWFKPSSKIFYWPFQSGTSFMDLLCFFSVLCLLYLCARLFICALWSPAGKGLTSWLSFVVSNCEFVTFPLVSWVRCGTWLLSIPDLCTLTYYKEIAYFTSVKYVLQMAMPKKGDQGLRRLNRLWRTVLYLKVSACIRIPKQRK